MAAYPANGNRCPWLLNQALTSLSLCGVSFFLSLFFFKPSISIFSSFLIRKVASNSTRRQADSHVGYYLKPCRWLISSIYQRVFILRCNTYHKLILFLKIQSWIKQKDAKLEHFVLASPRIASMDCILTSLHWSLPNGGEEAHHNICCRTVIKYSSHLWCFLWEDPWRKGPSVYFSLMHPPNHPMKQVLLSSPFDKWGTQILYNLRNFIIVIQLENMDWKSRFSKCTTFISRSLTALWKLPVPQRHQDSRYAQASPSSHQASLCSDSMHSSFSVTMTF